MNATIQIMTDEEKSQEIARGCFSKRTVDSPVNKLNQVIIKDACLKAMKWKEQQMIEKAVKWLKDNAGTYHRFNVTENRFYYNYNILIDDFKKAMEE